MQIKERKKIYYKGSYTFVYIYLKEHFKYFNLLYTQLHMDISTSFIILQILFIKRVHRKFL
jgi:S-adenosylmethionine:tRNA-ribosyltransferase-isomerase (queuine synthetase)